LASKIHCRRNSFSFVLKENELEELVIREGKSGDIAGVLALIKALARYEKAEDQVVITADQLLTDGFGASSSFRLLIADDAGECVGMALYYPKYSTWRGKCLFLEDLIVKESHRRRGIGKLLLNRLIEISKSEGMARLEWQVLDWNEPAINFYKKYKVEFDDTWLNVRIKLDNN